MHTLTLTTPELSMLAAAMTAVTPPGGGGARNSLRLKLLEALEGSEVDYNLVMAMCHTVILEARRAEVI